MIADRRGRFGRSLCNGVIRVPRDEESAWPQYWVDSLDSS